MDKIVFWDVGKVQVAFRVDEFIELAAAFFETDAMTILNVFEEDGNLMFWNKFELGWSFKKLRDELCRYFQKEVALEELIRVFNKPIKPLLQYDQGRLLFIKYMIASEGIRQGIMSNLNYLHLAYILKNFPLVTAYTDPELRFFSCKIGVRKPDMFLYVFDKLGVSPSQCVLIDDRPENVNGFLRLGGKGIFFTECYYKVTKALHEYGFLSDKTLRKFLRYPDKK